MRNTKSILTALPDLVFLLCSSDGSTVPLALSCACKVSLYRSTESLSGLSLEFGSTNGVGQPPLLFDGVTKGLSGPFRKDILYKISNDHFQVEPEYVALTQNLIDVLFLIEIPRETVVELFEIIFAVAYLNKIESEINWAKQEVSCSTLISLGAILLGTNNEALEKTIRILENTCPLHCNDGRGNMALKVFANKLYRSILSWIQVNLGKCFHPPQDSQYWMALNFGIADVCCEETVLSLGDLFTKENCTNELFIELCQCK